MVVVDGFADMDTRAVTAACEKVSRTKFGLDTKEVLQATYKLQKIHTFDSLFYDAAIESAPDLLDSISVENIIGNSSRTLRQCKDPETFFSTLDRHEIPYPEVNFEYPENPTGSWLAKHAMSAGGSGVHNASEKFDTDGNIYFQRKVEGVDFSLTFLANGRSIKPLGFNLLWVEVLRESMPYAYAGAINCVDLTQHQRNMAVHYANVLANEFRLVGLNSMDCILFDDSVYVIELNPRIPATYELYETKYGELLEEHIEVCKTHTFAPTQREQLLRAHAIVYAPDFVQIPKDFSWPLWTADRPSPEEEVGIYQPLCSVFAGGKNIAQVREMIHTRKKIITNKLTRTKNNYYQ